MLKWLWLSVVVIALDQLTKYLASSYLAYQQPVPVIPFFDLTLMYNRGAAFSFLSSAGGWQRWFFTAMALFVSVAIVFWIKRLESNQRWLAAALALVLGGALGNVWDRIALGHVVDFIDLYYAQWHWPAFNIADSAIFVGAVILVMDALFGTRNHKSPLPPGED
jgi:signal peptidase II